MSHSIFQCSLSNEQHHLNEAEIEAVSLWALYVLLNEYKTCQADSAADFYESVLGMLHAGSLTSRLREWQVLKYFNSLQNAMIFNICSLANPSSSKWVYPD